MKEQLFFQPKSSVPVAKQRLQTLLSADRMQCSPELINQMKEDVYNALTKYIEIVPENFELSLSHSDIHITYAGEH